MKHYEGGQAASLHGVWLQETAIKGQTFHIADLL
jgi:hypothetical protein